jgi:hypothetical protein
MEIYSISTTGDEPLSEDELVAVRLNAKKRLRLWRKRALYSWAALLLSCASVSPFLYGHPFHAYWEYFGKYLVLLSMALVLVCLYCTLLLWGAWTLTRDLEKNNG